jgi:acyl-CoA thioesterase FadM
MVRNGTYGTISHQDLPYTEVETGAFFLPLVEAHVEFEGRARYDDLLHMSVRSRLAGKARIRCENFIVHARMATPSPRVIRRRLCGTGMGKPIRPPKWLIAAIESSPNENSWED